MLGGRTQYAHGSGWDEDVLFGLVKGTKLSPQCFQLLILLFVKDEACSGHFGGSAAQSVWATQGPAGYVTVTLQRDSKPTSRTKHFSLEHAMKFF